MMGFGIIPFLRTNYLKAFLDSLNTRPPGACSEKLIMRNGISSLSQRDWV
ncbi:MAG: hypothetical protein LBT90_00945 [Holosporaceae bacterium]|nr:hypothetical protein [Holosporaceae bacterium]